MRMPTKDPSDHKDYRFEWGTTLEPGETILTFAVTPDPGITVDSADLLSGFAADGTSRPAAAIEVWLSSGTAGRRYRVACRVTTSDDRVIEKSLTVPVDDQ